MTSSKQNKRFSLFKQFKSFKYAFNGLKIVIREEHNFRIHICVTLLVLVASVFFKIEKWEWFFILTSIANVLITEIINTTIENLAGYISPAYNINIKKIKDLSAGAVLVSSFLAIGIGFIVFIPKINQLILSLRQN